MRNYEAVKMWATTVNLDKAINELSAIQQKYPWLKMPEITKVIMKMSEDMPKILHIIQHQETQNAIHRKVDEVNAIADAAIIKAVAEKLGYNIDE
jgi:hypothetical protein